MGSLARAATELLSGDLATAAGEKPSTTSAMDFGVLLRKIGEATGAT